jgi:hypothetical protein
MATSGTSTFTLTRDQIITDALIVCGVIDPEGGSPTTGQLSVSAIVLNQMVKAFMGHGLDLWTSTFAAVFLQPGQKTYQLGTGTTDHVTAVNNITGIGTIQSALTSNVIVIPNTYSGWYNSVATSTVAIGNTIGLMLDNGNVFWTTVANIVPTVGLSVVTLTATPTSSAQAGNSYYAYSGSGIDRPLRVVDCFVRRLNQNDVPVEIITRAQYLKFGLKYSPGTTNQMYYDPQLGLGSLYVYPTDLVASDVIYLDAQRPIQDFNASTDTADFPQEWLEAIVYGLAWRLCPRFNVPMGKVQEIKSLYKDSLDLAMAFDQEVGSIFIQPMNWQYQEFNN